MEIVSALVYASEADGALSDAELEIVLIKARTFNAARGITGVLLKMDHKILQYLEGRPEALARTFRDIASSPLHRDVRVLAQTDGVVRHFSTWHMGFHTYQQRHDRDEATRQWKDALPGVEAAVGTNAALATLLEAWRDLGGESLPTLASIDRE